MTRSESVVLPDLLLGAQRPRHLWVPEYESSAATEALELAATAGLVADQWQEFVTRVLLAERADGRWAAFEVALEVARQNGKGGIYEIRELAGLFLFGERLLIHSAHEYKTAEQALDRMEALLEGCADLSREVRTIKRSHGQEGIYLRSGQVLRYFTRTASGGRGFSCDFLGMDEAMKIKHSMHAAMFPTMSARPNPQILYAGSAVDQETMDDGVVFARLRERGLKGGDPRLAYLGWSAPFNHPDEVTEEDARNPEMWAQANPAMGIRITRDYIEMEQRSLSARDFAVERMGVGDWPATDGSTGGKISREAWDKCMDAKSECADPVCFVFDVSPDRLSAAISVAGWRSDGLPHTEVVDSRTGTGWVAKRLVELVENNEAVGVLYAAKSPAAALVAEIAEESPELELTPVDTAEHAEACGVFFDLVEQARLRHLGTTELAQALRGAATRPLGDAWAWARKSSNVNIAPLVACTLAVWGLKTIVPEPAVSREVVFL